jgi:organic hydroperoxide reductase OsmC/OhrA
MVEYSEDYHVSATATADEDSWQSDSRADFDVGIPPEFGGDFAGAAPENYYAVALTNCFVATFKVMAANSGLDFERIVANGTLKLRPADGTTAVHSFDLNVELHMAQSDRKGELLLERTLNHCFILDSVDFEVNVDHGVVVA